MSHVWALFFFRHMLRKRRTVLFELPRLLTYWRAAYSLTPKNWFWRKKKKLKMHNSMSKPVTVLGNKKSRDCKTRKEFRTIFTERSRSLVVQKTVFRHKEFYRSTRASPAVQSHSRERLLALVLWTPHNNMFSCFFAVLAIRVAIALNPARAQYSCSFDEHYRFIPLCYGSLNVSIGPKVLVPLFWTRNPEPGYLSTPPQNYATCRNTSASMQQSRSRSSLKPW